MPDSINYFKQDTPVSSPAPIVNNGDAKVILDGNSNKFPWSIAIIILVFFTILFGGGYFYFYANGHLIQTYDECVKAGYPVQESYPSTCVTQSGRRFVQPLPSVLPIPSLEPSWEASDSSQLFSPSPSPDINTCPETSWVDCMPSTEEGKNKYCSPEALSWFNSHCPGFQGAAY